MEEKELEQKEIVATEQEQPKKKGGKNSKKKETVTEDMVTETPVTGEPLTEQPNDEKPSVTETPAKTAPVEEPLKTPEPVSEDKNTGRKPVPTIPELRKMRNYSESIFSFTDGFSCVATSQRVADMKHTAWLNGE